MEVICTLPIKDYEFVIGKYLAILSLLKIALFLTGIMFINLIFVGTNIDYGAVFTGYWDYFLQVQFMQPWGFLQAVLQIIKLLDLLLLFFLC